MIDFLSAIGLIFILEGLLLFASPKRLKKILQIITIYPESKIRIIVFMIRRIYVKFKNSIRKAKN